MIKYYILFALIIIPMDSTHAQEKMEREYRIKKEQVPEKALKFVTQLGFTKKIKWYREEGLTKHSIEAKIKKHREKYSVEFDEIGTIEDIEKKIAWNSIPFSTRNTIRSYFDTAHQKVRIRKIQIQYTGEAVKLVEVVNLQKTSKDISIHYEIVVKAKTGTKYEMLEYLFTNTGEMRTKSLIINRNTDNLEY